LNTKLSAPLIWFLRWSNGSNRGLRREHDRVIESDDIDDQSLQFYPMKLLLQIFDLSNDDVGGSIFDEINRLGVDRLL